MKTLRITLLTLGVLTFQGLITYSFVAQLLINYPELLFLWGNNIDLTITTILYILRNVVFVSIALFTFYQMLVVVWTYFKGMLVLFHVSRLARRLKNDQP